MKRFKKALAVLLATLMVACSMPLTAFAAFVDLDEKITMSLEAYAYTSDGWGPYLEAGEGEGAKYTDDTELYAGDAVALAFIAHDVNGVQECSIRGWYEEDKIVPAKYVKKGTRYTLTEARSDDAVYLVGIADNDAEAGIYMTDDEANYDITPARDFAAATDNAAMNYGYPLGDGVPVCDFYIGFTNGFTGVALAENTVLDYIYNPEAPDDYDAQYVFDGVLYQVVGFKVLEDMTVADLYSCFHVNATPDTMPDYEEINRQDCCWVDADATTRRGVELKPYTGTVTPTEATYTFADGSTKTAAEAPANTVVADPINNNNGTHTTGYKWVADGDNAFKEQAVTADCSDFNINYVDTTCTVLGYDEYTCKDCGYSYKDNQATEYAPHDFSVVVGSSDATCTVAGTTTYKCANCDATTVVTGQVNPDNHTNVVTDAAVPATCTTPGKTEGSHCDDCGAVIVAQEETPLAAHDFSVEIAHTDGDCVTKATTTYKCANCDATTVVEGDVNPAIHANVVTDEAVPATCTVPGKTEGSHCAACGTVIVAQEATPLVAHDYDEGVVTKEPTRAEDGVKTYTCKVCGTLKEEAIEALGVLVTVESSELGTAVINGADAYGTTKVKYAGSYTLTAAPVDGAEFVGWMANGKMLTNEASYTTAAYADMAYTPVFAEVGQAKFTVTFVDTYGNVISVLDNNAVAALSDMPATNELAGYTFKEWSMTLDEVKALTDSATVYAYYGSDETNAYTITAAGCTINVNGVDYTDVATGVAYNAKVTVTPAESVYAEWSVNGTSAAYGETYSFLCGADTVVTYAEATEAVPTVAKVSMTKTATSNVAFLATRSVPEGYTLIESGFVYGKAMAEEDLVLENVGTVQGTDNGTVKSIACRNVSADGQFSLTYGVSAMNQNACARAYLIYADAAGATHAIYSDAMIYTY